MFQTYSFFYINQSYTRHFLIDSAKEVMFSRVSVCLSVCQQDFSTTSDEIFVKFYITQRPID